MALKNAARRLGRRALSQPISRTALRQLSTTTTTTTATTTTATPTDASVAAAEKHWTVAPAPEAQQKIVSLTKKKQKALQDVITSLGVDSAHEHRGAAWSTSSDPNLSVKEQFKAFQRLQKNTKTLGSYVDRRYVPTELISNPPRPEDISLELLMASQTHMGHNTSKWNPLNSRYIHGVRDGVHVISLETTAAHLRRAARVVEEVAYRGGLILFVGNRKGQMEIVTRAAELAGACHLFTKWTPGSITNRDVILRAQGTKVVDQTDQTLEDFDKFRKTARPLMPDLVVCLNPMENYTMLYECGLKDIPTIGIIDTDADPTWVTYTIPANDDSHRSVAVIAGVLGRAGQSGQSRRLADARKGSVTWSTNPTLHRHMTKEIVAALAKRKEVMGKMQSNVEGFNEEEQKLLQSRLGDAGIDEVSEADLMAMLGETAQGEEAIQNAIKDKAGEADLMAMLGKTAQGEEATKDATKDNASEADLMALFGKTMQGEEAAQGSLIQDMLKKAEVKVAEAKAAFLAEEEAEAAAAEKTPLPEEVFAEEATIIEKTPVVEETVVAEEAAAVEETPVAEETVVVEETPVVEEVVAKEAPVVEEAATVEETPIAEETVVVEEAPAAEETPIVKETVVVEEAPVVEEVVVIEEAVVAEQAAAPEAPQVEETQQTQSINLDEIEAQLKSTEAVVAEVSAALESESQPEPAKAPAAEEASKGDDKSQ